MTTWSKILELIGKVYLGIMILGSLIGGIIAGAEMESFLVFLGIVFGGTIVAVVSAAVILTFAEMGNNVASIKQNIEASNQRQGFYVNNVAGSAAQSTVNRSIPQPSYQPSNENMVVVKALKSFKDGKTGITHPTGEIFEISKERYEEISAKGAYIERLY